MPINMDAVLKTLAFGAAVAGANAIFEGAQKLKTKMAKDPSFKRMMDMHPELNKMDPDTVLKYWDNLYHFAPKMAQEPLAAGAYILQVSRMADFGGPTADTIKTVSEIEDKVGRKTKDPYLTNSKTIVDALASAMSLPGTKPPA